MTSFAMLFAIFKLSHDKVASKARVRKQIPKQDKMNSLQMAKCSAKEKNIFLGIRH